jgi:hypothetical protein
MNIRGLLYFSIVGLLGLSIQPDAKAEDFPFGVMYSYFPESVTGSSVDSLRDVLGFNIVGPFKLPSEALSRSRLEFFKNHGMNVVTYMMDSTDPAEVNAFASYMKAHYTMVQAEDEVSEVRFSYHHPDGYTDGDWFVFPKKDSSYTILDNFWYQHEKRYLGVQFEYSRIAPFNPRTPWLGSTSGFTILATPIRRAGMPGYGLPDPSWPTSSTVRTPIPYLQACPFRFPIYG